MILTDEIIKDFLKYLYDNDYRYLFIGTCSNEPLVSQSKPLFTKGRSIESTVLYDKLTGYARKLSKVILDNKGRCIDIAKELKIIDWATVKVDTKILVKSYDDGIWRKRYFACYENGKVYAFDSGKTSWSADTNHISDYVPWDIAEVVEE